MAKYFFLSLLILVQSTICVGESIFTGSNGSLSGLLNPLNWFNHGSSSSPPLGTTTNNGAGDASPVILGDINYGPPAAEQPTTYTTNPAMESLPDAPDPNESLQYDDPSCTAPPPPNNGGGFCNNYYVLWPSECGKELGYSTPICLPTVPIPYGMGNGFMFCTPDCGQCYVSATLAQTETQTGGVCASSLASTPGATAINIPGQLWGWVYSCDTANSGSSSGPSSSGNGPSQNPPTPSPVSGSSPGSAPCPLITSRNGTQEMLMNPQPPGYPLIDADHLNWVYCPNGVPNDNNSYLDPDSGCIISSGGGTCVNTPGE